MGPKRDHDALSYSDHDETPPSSSANKRQRHRAPNKGNQNPQSQATDLTYGQRCVFPGLGGATVLSDDDLEYEDEGDALAYLESVRLEASGIPNVLIAPKAGPQLPPGLSSVSYEGREAADRSIYTNGVGDSRGYYHDGAYTAAPDANSSDEGGYRHDEEDSANSDLSAQHLRDAYYSSLVSQFTTLRQQLHQEPPTEAVHSLPRNHETEVGQFGPNSPTFRVWTNRLRYTDPLPAQIAAMDKGSVLKLLRIILGDKFLRRGYELRERTSRWIWSLLARLPDRGEMGYMEIGWVRELGKRAVLMLISIAQMAALKEEVEDDVGEEIWEEEDREDDREFLGDVVPDEEDGEPPGGQAPRPQQPPKTDNGYRPATPQSKEPDVEDDDGGVDMDIDLDLEDGEVPDSPAAEAGAEADIAAAKARLLAQLDGAESRQENTSPTGHGDTPAAAVEEDEAEGEQEKRQAFDETRSRINMRATLNMILTVAGEFYGQRDLLEFRDPFTGL